MDSLDYANASIQQRMSLHLHNRQSRLIEKIKQALRRIEEGTFGECQDCGEEIGSKRLEARPTATLCVVCKAANEGRAVEAPSGRPIWFRKMRIQFSPA
jgi:DnaK suppressor protein